MRNDEQELTSLKELGQHMAEQLDKINDWKGGRDHAAELWFKPREFDAMGIRAMREEDNMDQKDFEQIVLGRRTTIEHKTLEQLADRAAELAEQYTL